MLSIRWQSLCRWKAVTWVCFDCAEACRKLLKASGTSRTNSVKSTAACNYVPYQTVALGFGNLWLLPVFDYSLDTSVATHSVTHNVTSNETSNVIHNVTYKINYYNVNHNITRSARAHRRIRVNHATKKIDNHLTPNPRRWPRWLVSPLPPPFRTPSSRTLPPIPAQTRRRTSVDCRVSRRITAVRTSLPLPAIGGKPASTGDVMRPTRVTWL